MLQGGTVRTGDAMGTRARALAVHDGRVVALDVDALALADDAAEVVDLERGALLPAFGDGHVHPLWGGVELAGPQVRDATTVGEVADVVRRWAADHPERDVGQRRPLRPEPRARTASSTRQWLDAAVSDRPVVLQATDHHCAWVNTAALRLAGIDEHTPTRPPPRSRGGPTARRWGR